MNDTGFNTEESLQTLLLQQSRLLAGIRSVQMFPTGTKPLLLPHGMKQVKNERGIFHYNPRTISEEEILRLSANRLENWLLELGPYSKDDIVERVFRGERLIVIQEVTEDGTEVRSAVGTERTLPEQKVYFQNTCQTGNKIVVDIPERVIRKMERGYGSRVDC